jgi:hypothetical protein
MGLLIYAGLVFLLSLAALKKQSRLILFLLQFQSFLFVFFFFWFTRDNYQILQVQKIGYQFERVTNNFRDPARSISIGGDQLKDDVYSTDLPPAAIRVTPLLSSTQAEVKVLADGILVLQGHSPLNALSLKDGDKIRCGDQELSFLNKGAFQRGFSYRNQNWNWPRNEWRLQKQKEAVLSSNFSSRLYTISEIAKSLGVSCDSKAAVSMQQIRFTASRNPVHINAVILFGSGKNLSVNGAPIPDNFKFQNQDVLRLYSIRHSDTPRLQTSASFRIQNGENLELLLPVPQILGIKEELLRNGSAVNKPLFLSTTTLPYSVFPTAHYAQESKKFSGLFAFVQTQEVSYSNNLWDQMEQRLQHLLLITPPNLEVVTDQGSFRPKYGDHFALGRSDKMIFSINKVDFPWILLQTLLVLWIAKMLFQPPFFAAVENVGLQLLVMTVDFFLVTRFLFSFRASNLYPFSSESLSLSLFAILLVPYLIFSASLLVRKTWERRQAYNFLAYSVIVCVLAGNLIGNYLWLTMAVVSFFSMIAFLRFHPRSFAPLLKTQFDVFRNVPVEVYLGLFVLFAFVLQALGTGEAVHAFGVRFPLALIYHPLLILFACYYINRIHNNLLLEKNADTLRLTFQDSLKLGLVLLCFVFISLLTSDFGFLLLYSVPLLFVLFGVAARYMREYEMSWKGAGLVMAVPLILFLFVFVGSGLIDKIVPLSSMGNRYIQRILLTVDPSVLQDSGLLTAERQLGHQRTFVAYSHSGLLGGGYMNRPITSALSGTALNDNVPAAFLLNDFGIAGFLAVCLMLFLWIFLWWKSHTALNFGAFVSLTALMTFVYVDLYMILSNCGIFLFTGKNFFFWGLNSISDIFHSTLLLFLLTAFVPRSAHA